MDTPIYAAAVKAQARHHRRQRVLHSQAAQHATMAFSVVAAATFLYAAVIVLWAIA